MSFEGDLRQAYVEWQRLVEAEGKAIRAGNWSFVAECQQALRGLTPIIDRLVSNTRAENAVSASETLPRKFSPRATILDLIELQRRNLASLEQRRQNLSKHIEHLGCASRELRRIQRSYASPAPAAWSSYG